MAGRPSDFFGEETDDGASRDFQIEFLSFEDVCEIHDRGIREFGQGDYGFLDEHAVRSAASQSEVGAYGEYFHKFPAGMAAAYLFYLTNQQGFLNGNKRAAVGSALEFLARNGYQINATTKEVYDITVELAGENNKADRKEVLTKLSQWIEQRLVPVE